MVLQLTKDEIPIWGRDMTGFYLPIPPILLSQDTRLNPRLANDVFPQVAAEWYQDLAKYLGETELDKATRAQYNEFIRRGKPNIINEAGSQTLSTVIGWSDQVHTDERGFATGLSISRNGGGTLYYNPSMGGNEWVIQLDGKPNRFFDITAEKARQLAIDDKGRIKVYDSHNIDCFPGALFLRNWGLAYINAAMASLS